MAKTHNTTPTYNEEESKIMNKARAGAPTTADHTRNPPLFITRKLQGKRGQKYRKNHFQGGYREIERGGMLGLHDLRQPPHIRNYWFTKKCPIAG